MVRKRKKQNKQWLCWLLVLVVIIAAVIAGVVVWQNSSEGDKYNEEQTSDVSEQEEIRGDETEATTTENAELKSEGVEKKKVVQYEGEDPNEADSLSGVITRADVTGQNLVIRVNIDQYLGSGRCELSLTRNGTTIYTDTASIVGVASTSTCEGFDVPVSGLGSGNTQINIKISADGREGMIRGEVDI